MQKREYEVLNREGQMFEQNLSTQSREEYTQGRTYYMLSRADYTETWSGLM